MNPIVLAIAIATAAAAPAFAGEQPKKAPAVGAEQQEKLPPHIERGRYLAMAMACNDCHSPLWLLKGGKTDEKKTWLTGDTVGWYDPGLGTTYPPNLRLLAANVTAEVFMMRARSETLRPPMPWFIAQRIKDPDLKAIYDYIRYLGPAGEAAPQALPPGPPPQTLYYQFPKFPPPPAN